MKLKKLLAMVLCVAMVLSAMGTVALAEEVVGVTTEEQLVAALAAGGTVKLGANIETTSTEEGDVYTYIMTGENAVLDLNGYTISPAVDTRWDDDYYYILICGDLTITDTSVGGNGKIYGKAFEYNKFHLSAECTYVDGKWTDAPTITVEGGNVENLALGDDVSVIVNGGDVSLCLYDSDYFYSEEEYSSYISSLTFKGVSADNFVNMPEGYELYIKSDGTYGIFEKAIEVATLTELQAALAAEGNAPILIKTQIVIPEGETVVLDLNGKNVIAAFNGSSTTNHIYALSNKGTLTVKDSVGTGSINSRGVYNYGTMTLESGKIAAIDGNGGYALNNEAGSTFVMNGGEVAATYEDDYKNSEGGYDATALDVPAGCTATLNGGKITSVCDFTYAVAAGGTLNIPESSTVEISGIHGAISVSGGTTTIDAGTFKVPYDNLRRTDNVMYIYGGSCIINNGTFIGDGDNYSGGCCVCDSNGGVVINGGNFSKSSGGDVWGTTGTKINGGTFENLIETAHVTVGATIINGGKKYVKTESGLVEAPDAVAKVGDAEYKTLAEAIAAAQSGDTVTILNNIETSETFTIADGKDITIDLGGKTITATDGKTTGNYDLFYNYGKLTVKNGTINLTATTDRVWGASSSIFQNRGGEIVVESGSYTHLGGTSMAYVIDNNANSYGDATTIINDGTITSTYVGIRNRMDTYNANGGGNGIATLVVNNGSITGKYAVWGQVASSGVKGNIKIFGGTLTGAEGVDAVRVGEDATGTIVTEISGGTFSSDVSKYVADGFKVLDNGDGTYSVAADFSITVYVMPNEIYEEVWETLPTEITAGKFEITNIEWPGIIEESWAPVGDEDGIVVEADYFEYNDDEVTLPEGTVPVVKFVTIPDTFALKVNGLDKDWVIIEKGSAVVIDAEYNGIEAAGDVKFFYSVKDYKTGNVDVEMTEVPENGVIDYFAGIEIGFSKVINIYGTVGNKELVSKEVTVLVAGDLFNGSIYNNATEANPEFSAIRVNNKRDYTVSFNIVGSNGSYDFSNGEFVVTVEGTNLRGVVSGANAANGTGKYTFTPDDMAGIANGAYTAKVTYSEKGEEVYAVTRNVNIAERGLWYTQFLINGVSVSGPRVTKANPFTAKITLDTANDEGNIYAGFKVVDYSDELVMDGTGTILAEGSTSYEDVISVSDKANGAYSLYALANLTESQNFYDFAFAKTIYVANSYTNLSGIYANGVSPMKPGIDANGGDLTITPNWGGRTPAGLNVHWTIKLVDRFTGADIVLDQDVVEGATVEDDGTIKVVVDDANVNKGFTIKTAKEVLPAKVYYVVEAYVDNGLDKAVVQRIMYID